MTTKMMMLASALAMAATAFAAPESKEAPAPGGEQKSGWAYAPGKGISFDDKPVFTAEFGLAFDSKYMTYGVIDGKDPILTPSAKGTFFDWVYVGISAIYDVTKTNGRRGGYGNRGGKYTTIDATAGIAHEFECGDAGTLSVDFNYIYEYFHRYDDAMDDTQYLNLTLSFDNHWLVPTLWIERDLMADDGTYVNFALSHGFKLFENENLTFTPSVAQGFGNKQRTRGYDLASDRAGAMDTSIKGELEYKINDWLKIGGYVAYYDYWFDSHLRDGARERNSEWGSGCHRSYNVVWGLALTATF